MDATIFTIPFLLSVAGIIFIFVALVSIQGQYKFEVKYPKTVLIIGIILLLMGIVLYINDSKPINDKQPPTPPATPTQSSTGNISVISSPSGAFVYLDSTPAGITPIDLTNIEQGAHMITLNLSGYYDSQQHLNLYAGSNVTTSSDLTSIQSITAPTSNPYAVIKNTWIEHGAYGPDGSDGMVIHLMFDVHNLKDKNCAALASFFDNDGKALPAVDQNYSSSNNLMCSIKYFMPNYVDETYSDFQIFMPYSEFQMKQRTDLQLEVAIHDQNDNLLVTSDTQYFFYNPC